MGIFGNDKDENETSESTDAAPEVAATDETAPEPEAVAEPVESQGEMIIWVRPSGSEITTNDLPATIAVAKENGWERK